MERIRWPQHITWQECLISHSQYAVACHNIADFVQFYAGHDWKHVCIIYLISWHYSSWAQNSAFILIVALRWFCYSNHLVQFWLMDWLYKHMLTPSGERSPDDHRFVRRQLVVAHEHQLKPTWPNVQKMHFFELSSRRGRVDAVNYSSGGSSPL